MRLRQRSYLDESVSKVVVIDFLSGQEPNDDDDEFATNVVIKFIIGDKELSQLLGKQQRVLTKELKQISSKQALALLNKSHPVLKDILLVAKRSVQNFITRYGYDEFDKSSLIRPLYFAHDDFDSVKVNPEKQSIEFTVAVEVDGKWR